MRFEVPGKPRGKGRPRFYNGHAITPAETASYENLVKLMYRDAGGALSDKDIAIKIAACFPIPKSWSKKKAELARDQKIRPTGKPDIDNIIKAVLDGLNGVAFKDDAQVVFISAQKLYSDTPRLVVIVENEEEAR